MAAYFRRFVLVLTSCLFTSVAQAEFALVAALNNPSGAPMGDFGRFVSVSPDGTRIAIGATLDDEANNDAGAVYLFDSSLRQVAKIIQPDSVSNGNFGHTLAWANNNQLVVGGWTPGIEVPVYVFDRNGVLERRIENPVPTGQGQFGVAVAARDGSILISSPFASGDGKSGRVYEYRSDGTKVSEFVSPYNSDDELFARSPRYIGDNLIAVGSFGASADPVDSGAVYLFDRQGNFQTKLVNPAPAFRSLFGVRIAAAGDDIVVGAYEDNQRLLTGGSAHLFSKSGAHIATFSNPNPSPIDWFGYSVSAAGMSGELVVVGAPFEGRTGNLGGAAYVFDKQGNLLQELYDPTPGDAGEFGLVYGYGDTLYVAASYDGGGAEQFGPGAVYIYKLNLLPGDVNMDSRVNLDDFISLRKHFGQDVNARADGDLTGDLKVDLADFIQLRANFGKVAPVPEPGGVVLTLLTAGGLAWMGVRRRRQ